jgi:hypothetical protein
MRRGNIFGVIMRRGKHFWVANEEGDTWDSNEGEKTFRLLRRGTNFWGSKEGNTFWVLTRRGNTRLVC